MPGKWVLLFFDVKVVTKTGKESQSHSRHSREGGNPEDLVIKANPYY